VQGPLSKQCEVACVGDQCVDKLPPVDDGAVADTISDDSLGEPDAGEPDTGSSTQDDARAPGASGDTVIIMSGKRSGGCSAGASATRSACLLVAAALLLVSLRMRRRETPR